VDEFRSHQASQQNEVGMNSFSIFHYFRLVCCSTMHKETQTMDCTIFTCEICEALLWIRNCLTGNGVGKIEYTGMRITIDNRPTLRSTNKGEAASESMSD